jgi:hypothetical protein
MVMPVARRLKGNVLRGFADHRTAIGRAYTQLVRDKQSELGELPRSARPIIREWARVVLELDRNAAELEKSGVRRRGMDCRRLKREVKVLRFTMLKLDQRLQQLAGLQKEITDPFEALFAGDA